MKPEKRKNYLLMIAVLVVFAGVTWYFTNTSAKPAEDAVLAYQNMQGVVQTTVKQTENTIPAYLDMSGTAGAWAEITKHYDGGRQKWQMKSCI